MNSLPEVHGALLLRLLELANDLSLERAVTDNPIV